MLCVFCRSHNSQRCLLRYIIQSPLSLSAGPEEDVALRGRKAFRGQALVSQIPETELMLEGDDDAASLLQEKEVDNLAGERTAGRPKTEPYL